MGDDRPSRYEENGRIIYRASALGMCMKTLVALGLGHKPEAHPDWLLKAFDEGRRGEPVVLKMLEENWSFVDEEHDSHWLNWHDGQPLIEVNVGTNVTIRGHADQIGTCYKTVVPKYGESDWQAGIRRLIEVKCTTEDYARVLMKRLPYYYVVQVSTYAGALGFEPLLVLGVKDENGDVKYLLSRPVDTITVKEIKLRVIEIERWIERGELPPCDHPVWPCPFSWLCDTPGGPATEDWELEQMLQKSIDRVERLRIHGSGAS